MVELHADKRQSNLLVLFIPSADRFGLSLPKREQDRWVRKAMKVLGLAFGGATAFPRGLGVWRDDARNGKLVWDKPVLIQCYTTEDELEAHAAELHEFLIELGTKTRQGAVGFVIDRDYFEIAFPLTRG